MTRFYRLCIALWLYGLLMGGITQAAQAQTTPRTLHFQALLADNNGDPVADGNYAVTLRLYTDEVGGTQVYEESHTVATAGGVFAAEVGAGTPGGGFEWTDVAFDAPYWLEVQIGSEAPLTPRSQLLAAPYAASVYGLRVEPGPPAAEDTVNVILGFGNSTSEAGGTAAGKSGATTVWGATVSGGTKNKATASYATVSGGIGNKATAEQATVSGGSGNEASTVFATIGGGIKNTVSGLGFYATIAGGLINKASANSATVGGGGTNTASGSYATVGGGGDNTASGGSATVGGGGGNTASGDLATVPGGLENQALGKYSFAAGHKARAKHEGSFVWNDASFNAGNDSLISTADNQFLIRADGGVGIGLNNPSSPLTVNGMIESKSFGFKFPDGTVQSTAATGGGGPSSGWSMTGNNIFATDFLGTLNNQPLVFKVNSATVLVIQPGTTPKVVAEGQVESKTGGFKLPDGYVIADSTDLNMGGGSGTSGWSLTGNAITAGQFFGTTTNEALDIRVNNATALEIQPGGTPKVVAQGQVESKAGGFIFPDGSVQTTAATGGGGTSGWGLAGNAGTTPGTDFIGTTDDKALDVKVNNERALRIEPGSSPNIIGGYHANSVGNNAVGATIAGGGINASVNIVTANYGTVSGGTGNTVSGDSGTISGGAQNTASGQLGTVGGGSLNTASGTSSAVGGGVRNTTSGQQAFVGAGESNTASGLFATIGGGASNKATGDQATVPGGYENQARGQDSFAAGYRARAIHDGSFVWNDHSVTNDSLVSTADNQFLIRAQGGVGIGLNNPSSPLTVNGAIESKAGGFKFPDGSVQASAASGSSGLPVGTIVMWSGSITSIPQGWALCAGDNGTPNLLDRFVVGVSQGEDPGAIGGNSTHDHSMNGTFTTGPSVANPNPPAGTDGYITSVTDQQSGSPSITVSAPAHLHHVTLIASTGSQFHLPPFFKLAFIMKCGSDPTNCSAP